MKYISICLSEEEILKLENIANEAGKSKEAIIENLILDFLNNSETMNDILDDPLYAMEGYESDEPEDFSKNIDDYLYKE